ncbi:MAG TPA: precorrin-6y C5,15-methyltransferase (decarboxylating) subunit CbiE [Afifellaceae bacterium]|nr:precorrin-6y C5,15-methyltransferase (decarboxylating) subunit CbiE [Afifellaceae bacterium]
MTDRWLSVIGIGEDGLAGLSATTRALLDTAQVLIGGKRHLAMLPEDGRERHAWPTPMQLLIDDIARFRGRPTAVLASGDPMNFGVGKQLAKRIPAKELTIVPAPSAFSLAAARLAWSLPDTTCFTLHGRPVETLACHVHPGARLLMLAQGRQTPAEVCAWLTGHGFGASEMTALAHMGGDSEARFDGRADNWAHEVLDLNTLAVTCIAGPAARWLPRTAGLPDEAFEHDGKITKREVRALAIARLMPHPGALLWDIGAGCGSVSVEWLRAAPQGRAIALEPVAERRAMAARNAAALGVPHCDIRDARAPAALTGLPSPDAVFIGGGLATETIETAIAALQPGGRLVADAVTLESEALLLAAHARHGGDLTRLAVDRAAPVGRFHGWRPAMPVTQWAWVKAVEKAEDRK